MEIINIGNFSADVKFVGDPSTQDLDVESIVEEGERHVQRF